MHVIEKRKVLVYKSYDDDLSNCYWVFEKTSTSIWLRNRIFWRNCTRCLQANSYWTGLSNRMMKMTMD